MITALIITITALLIFAGATIDSTACRIFTAGAAAGIAVMTTIMFIIQQFQSKQKGEL